MRELLFVFIGGGIGSTLRYAISLYWRHLSLHPRYAEVIFPWPTFIANILGCLLIGIFYSQSQRWGLSPEIRLLLTTGLCGGFTTFSTFMNESLMMMRGGQLVIAIAYMAISLAVGLICAWAGYNIIR